MLHYLTQNTLRLTAVDDRTILLLLLFSFLLLYIYIYMGRNDVYDAAQRRRVTKEYGHAAEAVNQSATPSRGTLARPQCE